MMKMQLELAWAHMKQITRRQGMNVEEAPNMKEAMKIQTSRLNIHENIEALRLSQINEL